MGEAKRRRQAGEGPAARPGSGRRWLLGGAAVLVVAALGGVFYWLTTPTVAPVGELPTAPEGAAPFPAELDRYGVSRGDPQAPVVVREFADYQCPACARFSESTERLFREYVDTGRVRYVYFDFPLDQHPNAVPAAMAARCAGDQDAYWPMHLALYDGQSEWADAARPLATFAGYADALELDVALFRRCMEAERHRAAVARSREVARQLRVTSTPTVLVDNITLTRPGWFQLAGVVERELGR